MSLNSSQIYNDFTTNGSQSASATKREKKVPNTRIIELKKSVFQDIEKTTKQQQNMSTLANNSQNGSFSQILNQTGQNILGLDISNNLNNISKNFNEIPKYNDTSQVLSTINQSYAKPTFAPFVKERDHLGRLIPSEMDYIDQTGFGNANGYGYKGQSLPNLKKQKQGQLLKYLTEPGEIVHKNQKYMQNLQEINHEEQQAKFFKMGQDKNAFKLSQLETDLEYDKNEGIFKSIQSRKGRLSLNLEQQNLLNNHKFEKLLKYNVNPEEAYVNFAERRRGDAKKDRQQLVAIKRENNPFFYDINKYCKVLKPRIPEAKIYPEHKNKKALEEQQRQIGVNQNYEEAKKITIEVLRAQYLSKLPQNPLKGIAIGKHRIQKQLETAKDSIEKQQQLSSKILNYSGNDMLNFETQLIGLKSIAKKLRNNLVQQREASIKRYNEQAIQDFQDDERRREEREQRRQQLLS